MLIRREYVSGRVEKTSVTAFKMISLQHLIEYHCAIHQDRGSGCGTVNGDHTSRKNGVD